MIDKTEVTIKKVIGTHTYIQEVTRHSGIPTSTKLVLIYLLEKYQATDEQGNPWNFSNASIRYGTNLQERTVNRTISRLKKANVLKHYGQIKIKTRPMNLYLFNLAALIKYLKDTDNAAMPIVFNDSKGAIAIDAMPKPIDTDKDTDKDTVKKTDHKEEYNKKSTEEIRSTLSTASLDVTTNQNTSGKNVVASIQGVFDTVSNEPGLNKNSPGIALVHNSSEALPGHVKISTSTRFGGGMDAVIQGEATKDNSEAIIDLFGNTLQAWQRLLPPDQYQLRQVALLGGMANCDKLWQAQNLIKEVSSI